MKETKSFVFEVVTPERVVLREAAEFVSLYTTEGSLGILHGHAPLLAKLKIAPLYYLARGEKDWIAVMGGILKVMPDRVYIMSDVAERAKEIDVVRAKKAAENAEAFLTKRLEKTEMVKLEAQLQKALVRLMTAKHAKQM